MELTLDDLDKHMKASRVAARECIGSQCLDEAAHYTSLMSYIRTRSVIYKQQAYALQVTEMVAGASATKAEAIMKASDEYKDYLIRAGYADDMLEQVRNMRAKGKGDDSEKQVTQ